jgi:hypothetical protein
MTNTIIHNAWLGNSDIDEIMRSQRKSVVSSIMARTIKLTIGRQISNRETPVRPDR